MARLPTDPDPNAKEVAPGAWLHWGLYLRGGPGKPLCPCESSTHPTGCRELAATYEGTPVTCDECAPWLSTGMHAAQFLGRSDNYSRQEREEFLADRELVHDEFPGWTEGELRDAFGK